ncbi:MAG TPA: DUF5615 family PIN-like protein [Thermoplasmata archaeon]|nr:DUF5615 family PIN-like protein [Thermoplasmata archaeon]
MAPPRLLADEMVGRLARYLRMVGCDTEYARGWSDDTIVERARAERRIVVTRDRELARRLPGSVLLRTTEIARQVREAWAALPSLPRDVRFDRCTVCNGPLRAGFAADPSTPQSGIPWDRIRAGLVVYRCASCGHLYWEGTHTASVRRRLREWTGGAV